MKTERPPLSVIDIAIPLAFPLVMWVVYWFEITLHYNFNDLGVKPGELSGLAGVLFGPFIHSGVEHLFNNTIPMFLLSLALMYFYRPIAFPVFIMGFLATGLLTWSIARPSYHIGASGVVYMLFAFLFFKGILSKHFRLIAVSMIVIFIYGSLVWGIFPGEAGISWEGHLSGLISGTVLAFVYRKKGVIFKYPQEERKKEEDDEFLRQFDEDGNFNPIDPEEEQDNASDATSHTADNEAYKIKYEVSKKKE